MISPMVEPSRKNLKGKAFRFGIFRGQFVGAARALSLIGCGNWPA
jgi:hypothetical protein